MTIDSSDYRVPPDKKVDLGWWPTVADSHYKSKKQYRELLNEHMEKLSSLQQLHYASHRWLIHTLVHGRANEGSFHVHGYIDRGTTAAPFDKVVLNEMSRFHLALDALMHVPRLRVQAANAIQMFGKKLTDRRDYIREHLEDMPEIGNWQWTADFRNSAAPAPLAKGHPQKAMFTDS
jgi:phosphoketolase